jgi:hypothetical protein
MVCDEQIQEIKNQCNTILTDYAEFLTSAEIDELHSIEKDINISMYSNIIHNYRIYVEHIYRVSMYRHNQYIQEQKREEEARLAAEKITNSLSSNESTNINSTVNYSSGQSSGGILTKSGGVNYYNGKKETYYNLNMSTVIANAAAAGIVDSYWVREDGAKMYGQYIIVASCDYSRGTIIGTSLGEGIVLDICPTSGIVDIATTW